MGEQLALAVMVHRVLHLRDQLGGRVAARDFDGFRVLHERARQLANLLREGGREQQVLARRGQQGEDLADVVDEAHVEHAIGLVQHQDLDLLQVDGPLLHVVEQPAGRGDDDVDPAAQRIDLRLHADAAVDARRFHLGVLAVGAHALLDLERELARRGDDQHADLLRDRGALRKELQDGQHKARGFPGAGLRGAEQVAACEDYRDGLRLDGGGNGVTLLGDSAEQLGRQAE
jgi:hypothetical protein